MSKVGPNTFNSHLRKPGGFLLHLEKLTPNFKMSETRESLQN